MTAKTHFQLLLRREMIQFPGLEKELRAVDKATAHLTVDDFPDVGFVTIEALHSFLVDLREDGGPSPTLEVLIKMVVESLAVERRLIAIQREVRKSRLAQRAEYRRRGFRRLDGEERQ